VHKCVKPLKPTLSLPSSAAAPPGNIFSTLTSGWVLEPLPPEMLIPVNNRENMARFLIHSEATKFSRELKNLWIAHSMRGKGKTGNFQSRGLIETDFLYKHRHGSGDELQQGK